MVCGIPLRGGAIQYHRDGPGSIVADVYGVAPRALRIRITRSMDDPGKWSLGPCYIFCGVEQEAAHGSLFLDGFVGSRDQVVGLRAAKTLLWEVWTEWRSRPTDATLWGRSGASRQ